MKQITIERLSHLYESLPFAVLYVNSQGEIISANPKALELIQAGNSSLVGFPLLEIFSPESREDGKAFLKDVGLKKHLQFACELLGLENRRFPAEIRAIRVMEEGEKLLQLLICDGEEGRLLGEELAEAYSQFELLIRRRTEQLSREIARSEKLNDELAQNQILLVHVEKMATLGLMAAMVTHEINNPLAFISSNFNTLGDYLGIMGKGGEILLKLMACHEDVEAASEYWKALDSLNEKENLSVVFQDCGSIVDECRAGVERLKDLARSLKDFTWMEGLEKEEGDLNKGLEATLRIAYPQIRTRCNLHKDLQPIPPFLCAPGQLNQVFLNLVLNAAQAIGDKGDVWVTSQVEGTEAVVSIRDNGQGIPKDKVSQIFDPFYTTKRKGEGTGLGLAICQNIVKWHHGKISVESEEGAGSCFTVRLPMDI